MKRLILGFCFIVPVCAAIAQIPTGYYDNAAGKTCASLKTALKTIITTGNTPQCYSPCLWTQYNSYDIKPRTLGTGSASVIYDIYSARPGGTDPYQFTPGNGTGGQQDQGTGGTAEGQFYNREHTVPQAWFNGSTSTAGPATDYMIVYPVDKYVNSKRGDVPYGEVATVSQTFLNGTRTGTSAVAGITGNVFEPIDSFKGDVARSFFYFITRYEDNIPGWSSNTSATQTFDNSTFPSVKIAYLKLMLKWNSLDPVSQKEIDRNNGAYSFQGNRNPYIDHPEYVAMVWGGNCPGLSALPVDLLYFTGKLENDRVALSWETANEINFDHYTIERSVNGTDYTAIGTVGATGAGNYRFNDATASISGQRVYYRLQEVNKDGSFTYSDVVSMSIPLNTKFSVYPNPASSFINLQLNNNSTLPITVQVSDGMGRVVINQLYSPNAGLVRIPVQSLTNGVYLVTMFTGGQQYTAKVIVAK